MTHKTAPKTARKSASAKPRSRRTTEATPSPQADDGKNGALRALSLAIEKNALEPVLLDVSKLCSFCNYQLVLSGRSDRQVAAIADAIEAGLKAEGQRPISAEGARSSQWALIDYGDFVVHVFVHSAREHYDLEGLWNDAPRVPIQVPATALLKLDEQYDTSAVS